MILADKIIELRKKNGWSQEELAERLDVSRQSVSKWEGAQSVPDMNKLLKLSEVFGVSTDYLLKDEFDAPERDAVLPVDTDSPARRVSMEEASAFLAHRDSASTRISLGVMLCVISPVVLILLGGLQSSGRLALTAAQVTGIGVGLLIILVGAAVALFVTTGLAGKRFEYLEEEDIETEYGVDGMVRERQERFRPTYTRQLTLGIVLCVIAVVPLFLSMTVFTGEDDLPHVISVALMLCIIGFGVLLLVRCGILWGGMNMLLEEGDYSRKEKAVSRKTAPFAGIYWCVVTAFYLGYSFLTHRWDMSWIVWPVAGVLFGAIVGVMRIVKPKA